MGNYKSVSTRRINELRGTPGIRFWQRNYWEHIIRDEQSLNRIREYMQSNPACWADVIPYRYRRMMDITLSSAPTRVNWWLLPSSYRSPVRVAATWLRSCQPAD